MIYPSASNTALAFLHSQPTREQFLKHTGVRANTYAAELTNELYDEVFIYSKNLRKEYLQYYSVEYPKFSQFASTFSSVPEGIMPKMDRYFQTYELIVHFYVPGYLQDESPELKTLSQILNTNLAQ